ncbi:hypothetical protein [Mesorhizobium sp.]|uniref:hypothetical protein n=1 Tax=Mesorhizobium sp. TaxID=1871066 RepID=UPI00338F6170
MLDVPPVLSGEDFSFMAQARPGAFIRCGNGDSAQLHHPPIISTMRRSRTGHRSGSSS